MAVEASQHSLLFHPQMLLSSTDNNNNNNQSTTPLLSYGGFNNHHPLMYNSSTNGFNDQCFPNNNMKAESGLTCSLPPVVSRKRMRDNTSDMIMNNNMLNGSFLGEDISLQMQQQQLEIDHYIANHTEKVRLEIEERRKRNSRRIIAAVEEGISKRLRAKEEEIIKIAKLNWALEEKVKSLCVENQIWRELAQTNEATANTLRNNLKQVLEQVIATNNNNNNNNNVTNYADADHDVAEDAQSCCESNNNCNEENEECSSSGLFNANRLCKKCGKDEACVLLLPCRHLCLCNGCGSSENVCPVCKSVKNISVHVNMSS
ncbi:zinc ion binding protein [Artemisia annua]|uniref:Zinc ion binding protein n=1 Tax=Artemisia annua TaxID=35608 RepID=A0A2U1LH86_ARTAN|nr:zinc ion binding protein [Artemisia annua]